MYVSASTTEALRRGSLKVSQIFFSLRGVPKWRKHKALQFDLMADISEALSKPVLQNTDIVDSMVESFARTLVKNTLFFVFETMIISIDSSGNCSIFVY